MAILLAISAQPAGPNTTMIQSAICLPTVRFKTQNYQLRRASQRKMFTCGALQTQTFLHTALQNAQFSSAVLFKTKIFNMRRASKRKIFACGELQATKFHILYENQILEVCNHEYF